ncbi:ion transporter [Fulvivirgaceae bacterium BMA10]|uniref:Ion transporter n=1 Tax=Splendidivirga corallicola TaxID=3051826 RepID=A0ABT8KKS3_9BACT|nr:ion transporter [Fulvivirgaceae bacterium BMA10]
MSLRRKIFEIIHQDKNASKLNGAFSLFVMILILLNVLAIILESFKGARDAYSDFFHDFEIFSVAVFTIEYLLRIWTCDLLYKESNKLKAMSKFIFSPLGLIDLLAILPFYLPLIIAFDMRFVRILRVVRLIRIFKLNRYSSSLKLIMDVIKEKKAELGVTLFMSFVLLFISSTLMFYIEGSIQPEAFPNILATFWWAIATLTTVGYGDVYPVTEWGKILSSIIAILGIGMVALPTGLISSEFMDKFSGTKKEEAKSVKYCPHCGEKIHK